MKTMTMKNYIFMTLLVSIFSLPLNSYAGVTHALQNTAVTQQPKTYEARAQGDLILNRGGGVNVSGHMKTGLIEDMLDIEGFLGTGKTDFKIGAQTKFNLLPDIPGQVALAFLGGFTYIMDDYGNLKEKDSINVISGAVLLSKKLAVDFGSINPYAGFQVEMLFKKGDNDFPLTGILGAEWNIQDLTPFVFFSEMDLDVSDSVFLLSFGGAYRF